MSEKIVTLNEEVIKGQIKELVRGSVEETLNELLEAEAEKLTQAGRYERNEARQGYRSGHYDRNLTTTAGDVTLHVPRLKGVSFETAIIERYRRRESSVEEALIEMYLAGVSVRRVEDITEALWGSKVSPSTISELNKKAYIHIEDWRNRPLQGGRYPYVYVDGIYLRRNWGGEFENVAILVAIAVNEDGYREVLGAAEGMKEDKASWVSFFRWLRGRGLDGVKLVVGDKCLGMLEAVGEVFPEAKYQRCTVRFYRNVFSVTPRSKVKLVAKMLKAIHAQASSFRKRSDGYASLSVHLRRFPQRLPQGLPPVAGLSRGTASPARGQKTLSAIPHRPLRPDGAAADRPPGQAARLVAKKQPMLPKCYQKWGSKPWGTRGSKLEVSGMATRMLPAALFRAKSAAFFMSCPRFRILFPGVRGVTQSCTAKTPQNPPKPGHFPGKLSGFLGSLAAKSKKEEFQ